jgi:hypothetical protein
MARTASKKTLRNKLDNAWSRAILSKGSCEVCGETQYLNPHHIEGRRNLRLRWDLRNGVCLCSGCHTFRKDSAHQAPEWFHFWLEEHRWEDLQYVLCHRDEIKKWALDEMSEHLDKLNRGYDD